MRGETGSIAAHDRITVIEAVYSIFFRWQRKEKAKTHSDFFPVARPFSLALRVQLRTFIDPRLELEHARPDRLGLEEVKALAVAQNLLKRF